MRQINFRKVGYGHKCGEIVNSLLNELKAMSNKEKQNLSIVYRERDLIIFYNHESTVIIPYSNNLSNVIKQGEVSFIGTSKCYVHYNVTNSDTSNKHRFVTKTYMSCDVGLDAIRIGEWNFKKKYLTPLPNIEDDCDKIYDLLLTYVKEYMKAKEIEVNEVKRVKPLKQRYVTDDNGMPSIQYYTDVGEPSLDDVLEEITSDSSKRDKMVKQIKVEIQPKDGLSKKDKEILNSNTKRKYMSTLMTATEKAQAIAKQAIEINKEAVILASKLEIGNVAVQQIRDKVKLPFGMGKYKKNPMFDIILANVVGTALRQVATDNEKAQIIGDAMIQSAMVNMAKSFNINDMVNDLIGNIDLDKFMSAK